MLGLQHDRILMYHGTPRRDAAALERQLGLVKLAFPVVPLDELLKKKSRRARVAPCRVPRWTIPAEPRQGSLNRRPRELSTAPSHPRYLRRAMRKLGGIGSNGMDDRLRQYLPHSI